MLRLVIVVAVIAVVGFIWWASAQYIEFMNKSDKKEENKNQ